MKAILKTKTGLEISNRRYLGQYQSAPLTKSAENGTSVARVKIMPFSATC
jgi:hypothetical protein